MKPINTVTITSATALSADQQQTIKTHLQTKLQTPNANFTFEVTPDVIGGLIIQIDDTLVDASLAGKLDQLKSHFKRTLSL
ncbi:MAG: F0F1 ATP synthase subunit delta [bacterium]